MRIFIGLMVVSIVAFLVVAGVRWWFASGDAALSRRERRQLRLEERRLELEEERQAHRERLERYIQRDDERRTS